MQQLEPQKRWLKYCIFFLSLYYISVYLDPNLSEYICNCGLWGNEWPKETSRYVFDNASVLFSSFAINVFIIIGIIAAIMLNFNRFLTVGVIITLVIQAIILFRNPSFYLIHRPYIGTLTAFLPFIVHYSERLFFKFTAMDWLWSASAVTYLASAVSKLQDPFWISGTALSQFYGFPIRSKIFLTLTQSEPVTALMTYSVIAIELLYGVVAYFNKFRFICWVLILLMHLGILFFLQIYVATLPMILFHLFLFDTRWIVFIRRRVNKNAA